MSADREQTRRDVPSLEELLATGQVRSALLLKGSFTDNERELIRQAYEAGCSHGRAELEQAERKLASLAITYAHTDVAREQAERALDAAMQYVAPKDREWIEGLRRGT